MTLLNITLLLPYLVEQQAGGGGKGVSRAKGLQVEEEGLAELVEGVGS